MNGTQALVGLNPIYAHFIPQWKNIWGGREGVKTIPNDIPKAKLLKLSFEKYF